MSSLSKLLHYVNVASTGPRGRNECRRSAQFDVLLAPDGYGQQELMNDEEVLQLIRNHFAAGRLVFSVCMGALLCGVVGILRGCLATTHWAAWELLPYYGVTPV